MAGERLSGPHRMCRLRMTLGPISRPNPLFKSVGSGYRSGDGAWAPGVSTPTRSITVAA